MNELTRVGLKTGAYKFSKECLVLLLLLGEGKGKVSEIVVIQLIYRPPIFE